jgi:S-phase kinase-associated protein 1
MLAVTTPASSEATDTPIVGLDDSPAPQARMVVVTCGHVRETISYAEAEQSELLKTSLTDPTETEVPLPEHLGPDAVALAMRFLRQNLITPLGEFEKPIKSALMYDFIDQAELVDLVIDLDQTSLFELTNVANYMHIEPLIWLCAAKIATLIKDKTPSQIRETFGVEDDMGPEETRGVLTDLEALSMIESEALVAQGDASSAPRPQPTESVAHASHQRELSDDEDFGYADASSGPEDSGGEDDDSDGSGDDELP